MSPPSLLWRCSQTWRTKRLVIWATRKSPTRTKIRTTTSCTIRRTQPKYIRSHTRVEKRTGRDATEARNPLNEKSHNLGGLRENPCTLAPRPQQCRRLEALEGNWTISWESNRSEGPPRLCQNKDPSKKQAHKSKNQEQLHHDDYVGQ